MALHANRAAVALLAAVLASCGSSNGTPTVMPTTGPPPNAFDTAIATTFGPRWGVVLGVFVNGSPYYIHAYGLRDRGLPESFYGTNLWGTPQPDVVLGLPRGAFAADANTIFDIASVSKEFTAGAILLLQQDGKLSVDDSVSKYFPSLPGAASLTLRNLLQHSSGYVDYNNFESYPDFSPAYSAFMQAGETNDQPIVNELATFPLEFAPGTAYAYSNTNYMLLGDIVSTVSGEPLGAFLQQRIFTPLGMTRTHQGYPPAGEADIALGYTNAGGSVQRTYQWNLTWLAGPGGLTSTVGDLDKWDEALHAPGLFTQASLAEMFAPGPYPQSFGTYAFGWVVSSLDGHRYIWHDGAVGGFTSINALFPDDGIEIVVLTNDGNGPDPYDAVPALFQATLQASGGARTFRTARKTGTMPAWNSTALLRKAFGLRVTCCPTIRSCSAWRSSTTAQRSCRSARPTRKAA